MPNVAGIRRFGAASLDLAYVAAGRFDAFWERDLSAWDIAAGLLLVKEAQGMVSDLSNGTNMLDNGTILAANEMLHPQYAEDDQRRRNDLTLPWREGESPSRHERIGAKLVAVRIADFNGVGRRREATRAGEGLRRCRPRRVPSRGTRAPTHDPARRNRPLPLLRGRLPVRGLRDRELRTFRAPQRGIVHVHHALDAERRQRRVIEFARPLQIVRAEYDMRENRHYCLLLACCFLKIKHHHAANAFAFVHKVKSVVDFIERHRVRNQVVDVDLARPCTSRRSAAPELRRRTPPNAVPFHHAAGDKLEQTRLDPDPMPATPMMMLSPQPRWVHTSAQAHQSACTDAFETNNPRRPFVNSTR